MGRFEDFHNLLYVQTDSIGLKPWTSFASDVGINDTMSFSSCMLDPAVEAVILRDSSAAMALGARATPTFLINDVMVSGNIGFNQLNELVKAALREAER